MLAVTAGTFLLVRWVTTKVLFFFSKHPGPLKSDWQRHVLASSGYLELGMFDDAAQALEEIAPEDRTRNEVLALAFTSTWQPRNRTWLLRLPAIW